MSRCGKEEFRLPLSRFHNDVPIRHNRHIIIRLSFNRKKITLTQGN